MSKEKPSLGKEIDKMERQFQAYEEQIKSLTTDRLNEATKEDVEPQTKLSSKQIEKSKEIYLKPERYISDRAKFNEDYREQWNYAKEYVQFIAENREIIGETIEMWTKPFAGIPCEFWKVPVNKPVWGPRYLAEQIKRCCYHKFQMQDRVISGDGIGQYYGSMVVDTTIQRLDAVPASTRKSVFMGANNF